MRRQALLNLFMLILVAALTLVVLFGPEPDPSTGTVAIGTQAAADIRRIELHIAGSPALRLERSAGDWILPGKPRWRLNATLIDRVLALPQAASHARYPIDGVELGELGLVQPRLRVLLNDTEYRFGAQEPLNNRRYVQVGDRVHLITDTLIHQLGGETFDWVSRRPLPPDATPVRVKLPHLTLDRDAEGRWRLDPANAEIAPDAINTLIDEWRFARALAVEPYRAVETFERIEITLPDDARALVFEAVRGDDAWFLQRADLGLRYRFDAAAAQRLLRLPAASPVNGGDR